MPGCRVPVPGAGCWVMLQPLEQAGVSSTSSGSAKDATILPLNEATGRAEGRKRQRKVVLTALGVQSPDLLEEGVVGSSLKAR